MDDARTTESLLARRALAEKATPGDWAFTGLKSKNGGYYNRLIHSDENPDVTIASMNSMSNPKCVEDADYLIANSPDVIMADIDEILCLRAENEKLKQSVEIQRGMVQAAQQTAALAWDGEIPSPLPGHRSMTEEEVAAMFEHRNCPWCGGSGHVGDCEEADQQVKSKLERLDKEADCLATWLATAYIDCSSLPEIDNGMSPPDPYQVREAAREAVENATKKR